MRDVQAINRLVLSTCLGLAILTAPVAMTVPALAAAAKAPVTSSASADVQASAITSRPGDQYPSLKLNVPLTRPLVKSISNVVFSQVPSRGYDNVALKMDVLQPAGKGLKPAVVFVTGGGFINANKDNGLQNLMA